MTSSLVLATTARWLAPAMLASSIWLVVRGHDAPGGGFVGGLVAVAAYLLQAFAEGAAVVRSRLRVAPEALIASGLMVALASAAAGPLRGAPWMTGCWFEADLLGIRLVVGTPLLFDAGVFLVVLGSGLTVFLPAAAEPG